MARDTLALLHALRRFAVDRAVQTLAACIAAETAAAASVATIEDTIPAERAFADARADAPHAMEDFARWSAEARSRRDAGLAALALTQAQTASARTHLAEARSEASAVEELIAVRTARARELAERGEAHALDDIARTLRQRG
jgi:flagellar export protein FliJ